LTHRLLLLSESRRSK